jgi:hypothetical protein
MYSEIAVLRRCVGNAFPSVPTLTETVMKTVAELRGKTFPDAKTVNTLAEYSVKKWFNRDFL